jgi:two-component system phosphate regulon response regulator PhoB/two-component system alkaline phosphatase synthesis response regulator PhoP
VSLTPTEFNILKLLASKKGHAFTREAILHHLWGEEKIVVERTVDVHIRHLREKLGKAGDLIQMVKGVGYMIEE